MDDSIVAQIDEKKKRRVLGIVASGAVSRTFDHSFVVSIETAPGRLSPFAVHLVSLTQDDDAERLAWCTCQTPYCVHIKAAYLFAQAVETFVDICDDRQIPLYQGQDRLRDQIRARSRPGTVDSTLVLKLRVLLHASKYAIERDERETLEAQRKAERLADLQALLLTPVLRGQRIA